MINANNMLSHADWLIIVGLGLLWIGAQIIWAAPLPRQLRRGDVPTAPKGSAQAFMLFWLDQYGWLGICLCVTGLFAVIWGGFGQ